MLYLGREKFRELVFARDDNKCVVCGDPAQDAHHIMERRLFDDGGYYLDNGASLCGACHLGAEQTSLSPETIRARAGIQTVWLPDHLYPDYEYDKWGNIMNANGTRIKGELFFDESVQKALAAGGKLGLFMDYVKYPRTYHLPFSRGRTDDDKALLDTSYLLSKRVVVTVKMDGENTSGYWNGKVHARSLDSRSHPSQDYIRNKLGAILFELPKGWRICGENLYAKHTIPYSGLGDYFQLFSIWNDKNECLSWDETLEWAALLGLKTVPVLFQGEATDEILRNLYEPSFQGNLCEGFVVRRENSFTYGEFRRKVAKFVRANHVTENIHWLKKAVVPNEL